MVPSVGFDPTSAVLQTVAITRFANSALIPVGATLDIARRLYLDAPVGAKVFFARLLITDTLSRIASSRTTLVCYQRKSVLG